MLQDVGEWPCLGHYDSIPSQWLPFVAQGSCTSMAYDYIAARNFLSSSCQVITCLRLRGSDQILVPAAAGPAKPGRLSGADTAHWLCTCLTVAETFATARDFPVFNLPGSRLPPAPGSDQAVVVHAAGPGNPSRLSEKDPPFPNTQTLPTCYLTWRTGGSWLHGLLP